MKWEKVSAGRWELQEGTTVLAIIRQQREDTFEWITRYAHQHASSLASAKRLAEKEVERR